MAASTFAVVAGDIIDLENLTANDSDDVDANTDEIITQFNASLETSTGHYHDGTDSRSLAAGAFGLTLTEYTVFTIMDILG